jgi:hypothetical protein
MAKQTVLAGKRRGPAPTGKGVQVVVRLQPDPLSALDKWALKQGDQPTRPEAIRRLIELGLKADTPAKAARSTPNKLRAAELAAKAIDNMHDPAASTAERDERRRRLTKGPPEFREVRVDRPKVKK